MPFLSTSTLPCSARFVVPGGGVAGLLLDALSVVPYHISSVSRRVSSLQVAAFQGQNSNDEFGDIGFDSEGNTDEATIAELGFRNGADGSVTVRQRYDGSGNNRHLIQTNRAAQAFVAEVGGALVREGGRLAQRFTGAGGMFFAGAVGTFDLTNGLTIAMRTVLSESGVRGTYITLGVQVSFQEIRIGREFGAAPFGGALPSRVIWGDNGNIDSALNGPAGTLSPRRPATLVRVTTPNNSASSGYIDGALDVTGSPRTDAFVGNISLGARSDNSEPLTDPMQDVIILEVDGDASGDRATIEADFAAYFGGA